MNRSIFFITLSFLMMFFTVCANQKMNSIYSPSLKKPIETKTVVFIHGLYMTNICWSEWKSSFKAQGYRVVDPSWPIFKGKTPGEIRTQHPDALLARLELTEVIDYYTKIVKAQKEKPIIIGHSMGGLITQILMERNLGAAGVAIHSVPPPGVSAFSMALLRNNWAIISPFADENEPIWLDLEDFKDGWMHNQSNRKAQLAYDTYFVPASRKLARGAQDKKVSGIDFKAKRPPLLLVAGDADQTIPLNLTTANYEAYSESPSVTDFKVFKGRTHFTLGQSGWENVSKFIIKWLNHNQGKIGKPVREEG
ncbi:MAG: alpha/beta hydrolase [Spirochaetota bacterium]